MQAVNLYLGSIERSLVTAAMTSDERARATESLLRLQQSIGYMNDVFDSVLDISRLDSGAMEVRMERVHAWSFCERVLAQHQRMADDLGLVLELRGVDASQMALKTDPRLLERILRNFISNAMRYTKRGGLRLRIAQHGVLCRISIVDTGSGIAAPLRKKMLAPGLGIDIITAGGSVDAIRQLAMRGIVPSLLMIDAQLQSESVAQVITLINDEFNTTVPVVLCSDEALVANIEQHAGSPVTLLQRPFSTEKLREAINAALSGWSARQG
jgi:hypothetical protein